MLPAPAFSSFRRCTLVILTGLILLAGSPAARAQAEVSKEYQVKAAFIYNFTKFVDWPPARFADQERPITIGVLGTNSFGEELQTIVRDRLVNGRKIVVRVVEQASDAISVDLLFIGASEEKRLPALLPTLVAGNVLTVGETSRFCTLGGIIAFSTQADKVRFEINQEAASQAGLKISAQLLKLATAVHKKT